MLTNSSSCLLIAGQETGDFRCLGSCSCLFMEEYSGGFEFCLSVVGLENSCVAFSASFLTSFEPDDFALSGIDEPFRMLFIFRIPLFGAECGGFFVAASFFLSVGDIGGILNDSLAFFLMRNEKCMWPSFKYFSIVWKVTAAQSSLSRNRMTSSLNVKHFSTNFIYGKKEHKW